MVIGAEISSIVKLFFLSACTGVTSKAKVVPTDIFFAHTSEPRQSMRLKELDTSSISQLFWIDLLSFSWKF